MPSAIDHARRTLSAAALLLVVPAAFARPVLVAPIRLEVPRLVAGPPSSSTATVYDQVVIDGNTLMVGANRATDASGTRRTGIYIFERAANGAWNFAGPLIENLGGSVRLQGNLAVVHTFAALLIFERGPQGWTQTDSLESETGEWSPAWHVFRIDDGALYVAEVDSSNPPRECLPPMQEWRRVNGTWTAVATIGGQRCTTFTADVNDGRALLATESALPQAPATVYVRGAPAWPSVAQLAAPPLLPNGGVPRFGIAASLSGDTAYVDNHLYRDTGGNRWVAKGTLYEPEIELDIRSGGGTLRGNTLVVAGEEEDYDFPYTDVEINHQWRTLRAYRKLPNGFLDYYAKLSVDYDVWGYSLSEDGRRVAAVGIDNEQGFDPVNRLYVFEIPDAITFNGTQQDTFEAGNFARWTPTFGQFAVATNGSNRVLRQSSLAGDAQAYLTAVDWADQSIEADLRPLQFAATDRWFGLVTRRVDADSYYYATFRSPDVISLRRMQNGVVTVLAQGTLRGGFVQGRSYRVRLESVGDQHAVFVEGMPRLHAKDSAHASGHPGLVGFGTRFEADNVVVSNATRLLARLDTWERWWSFGRDTPGQWDFGYISGGDVDGDGEGDIYANKQKDTTGDVKRFSKIPLGNQIVSARVRPVRYGATTPTQDAWFGVAVQVKDENNYYYATLRDSNELSLRRMVNGQVQVLATVPQTVTTGAWHDLRVEIINTSIRVHVNGTLKIQMNDPTLSGGGRNGLLMYKAAADWLSYVAYQP